MEQNEKDFLLRGITTAVTKKAFIQTLFLLTVTLIPTIFIGGFSIVITLMSIAIIALYVSNVYAKFDDKGIIKGYVVFLCSGIEALCLTISWLLLGTRIQFLISPQKYHMAIIAGLMLGGGVFSAIYILLIKALIKKGHYRNLKAMQGSSSFISMGVLGMMLGRVFFKEVSSESALQFLAGAAFVLASIFLIGLFGLCKYYIIKNNEELMRELEEGMEITESK